MSIGGRTGIRYTCGTKILENTHPYEEWKFKTSDKNYIICGLLSHLYINTHFNNI